MKKSLLLTIVDAAAFVALTLLAATGALIHSVLPPGSGHFQTIWRLDRHDWGEIHFSIALTFLCLMLLHLILHWSWIVHSIRGRGKQVWWRMALVAAVLFVLFATAASPFFTEVVVRADRQHKMRLDNDSGVGNVSPSPPAIVRETTIESARSFNIKGSMTLHEIEELTGVPASVVIRELGLPNDFPQDQTLGRLRKKYPFDMHKLREVVENHLKSLSK
jgi:hypothetical protein